MIYFGSFVDFFFGPEYANILGKLLLGFGIFVIIVFFVIPHFFPSIQYKLEEFRNRKHKNGEDYEE